MVVILMIDGVEDDGDVGVGVGGREDSHAHQILPWCPYIYTSPLSYLLCGNIP